MIKNSRDKLNELHGYKKAPVATEKKQEDDAKGNFFTRWWAKKDDDGKRFIWYVVVITAAFIAEYIAPEGKGLIFRGVVALVGAHLIWTFVHSGKISALTWAFVIGMLTYFVLVWVYPNDMPRIYKASRGLLEKMMQSAADNMESAYEGYGKTPVVQSVEQQAQVVDQPEITSVQLTIPVDETVFVAPPQGYRLSSALCPAENVMEISNGRDDEILRQVDCAGQITLDEAELYGKSFAFFQKPGGTQSSIVVIRWIRNS